MPGGFRISLEGDERLIGKLGLQNEIARRAALRATHRGVEAVKNRAHDGIANGPKTGRIYTQRFATSVNGGVFAYGSRPPHQASAPDEYPAADTGNLMRSLWAEVDDGLAGLDASSLDTQLEFDLEDLIVAAGEIAGSIGCDAEYAAPLEYKPTSRGGRPFLRRALSEARDEVHAIYIDEMRGQFG